MRLAANRIRTATKGKAALGSGRGRHVIGRSKILISGSVITAIGAMLVLGCFLFIMLGRSILPATFSYDADMIQSIALGELSVPWDESYQHVGEIYGAMGLGNLPTLAGLLGFGLYCLTLPPLFLSHSTHARFTVITLAITVIAIFVGAAFLGTFSKDFLVAPIAILVVLSGRAVTWDIALVLAMAVYAMAFREYWFIIIVLFIGIRIMTISRFTFGGIAFVVAGGLAGLAVLFSLVLGVELTHFRELVNVGRMGSEDARTLIMSYLPLSGIVGSWLNALATILMFFVPLPLLLLRTPYHALLFVFFVVLWGRYFLSLWRYTQTHVRNARINRMVALIFGFTAVQSIFEPDYGSYLRHLTPLLPVMILTMLEADRLHRSSPRPASVTAHERRAAAHEKRGPRRRSERVRPSARRITLRLQG